MPSLFVTLFKRDLFLASRRRGDVWLPLVFFAVALALFPLGVGPRPQTLRLIAPGVVWVCALLASMLSVSLLFADDHADGTLDQLLLAGPAWVVALARATSHWLLTGLPLLVAAPLLAPMWGLSGDAAAMLAITLLLGTPVLSLLGAMGAALTLGLRQAGMLVVVIVLPLAIPAVIFATGAVAAADDGQSATGHVSLLAALLILTALVAPPACSAALRLAVE